MSLAHFTLATQHVERTADFFERTLGYTRNPVPANSPVKVAWLNLGRGQEIHVIHTEGFTPSPFELEFGRHVAVFHPAADFPALKQRLIDAGAEIVEPLRPTAFERFFFREPVNGYLFEVIDAGRKPTDL
jgi:catechol 2,3-dioxygenase-like lactoylglutathione lyase family enzyme